MVLVTIPAGCHANNTSSQMFDCILTVGLLCFINPALLFHSSIFVIRSTTHCRLRYSEAAGLEWVLEMKKQPTIKFFTVESYECDIDVV